MSVVEGGQSLSPFGHIADQSALITESQLMSIATDVQMQSVKAIKSTQIVGDRVCQCR